MGPQQAEWHYWELQREHCNENKLFHILFDSLTTEFHGLHRPQIRINLETIWHKSISR